MVINTNEQSLKTANTLLGSSASLAKSLSRLSSGNKIIQASDDAAGLAVSSRLTAQLVRLDAAVNNVVNAGSFTQTQEGFLKTIDKSLQRMGELTILAQDETKSSDDRLLYNKEFVQLRSYIQQTAEQTFNSIPLFGADAFKVTIDSEGSNFEVPAIDFTGDRNAGADWDALDYILKPDTTWTDPQGIQHTGLTIETLDDAAASFKIIQDAIHLIAQKRSSLGAIQSRLQMTQEQLASTKENLSSAVSRIADVDVAQETTDYARQQILVQSGTMMLLQANKLPQACLQLINA